MNIKQLNDFCLNNNKAIMLGNSIKGNKRMTTLKGFIPNSFFIFLDIKEYVNNRRVV